MEHCLVCRARAETGVLCRECARQVAPCEGLIPGHIRSTVTPSDDDAWVVDGFGCAHALAERTTIGRNDDGQLVVLAASVSREHAELRRTEAGWQLRDLGSRNGTFVDDTRCAGRVTLPRRARIRVGDVALWFLAEVEQPPVSPPSMETVDNRAGLVRYLLRAESCELCVFGDGGGGRLLVRDKGSDDWLADREQGLSQLEFRLLARLCAAALAEADAPSPVRGCVPTPQLASDLPFRTRYANDDNVRQVVRRLRETLAKLGAAQVLAVAPGRGYYLACPVSPG